jgi:uncharacterized protein
MAGIDIDTSALGRVLLAEPDASAIRDELAAHDAWWSSALLAVEFRRLARREGLTEAAERLLNQVRLIPITEGLLHAAARIDPADVRTLDAIHLAAAVELHDHGTIGGVLSFDRHLQSACRVHGIRVAAPQPG